MSKQNKSIKTQAIAMIMWQFVVIAGLSVTLFFLRDFKNSISCLLGGMAYWLANLFFAIYIFARNKVRNASQFVIAFFIGETIKLFVSAVLFVLIVKFLSVNISTVLFGYIAAIFAFWVIAGTSLWKHPGASI